MEPNVAAGCLTVVTFEEYMGARYASLRRLAYLLCGDWSEAEDVVQIALARCQRRWGSIRSEDPHSYVRRAVVNAAHNERRRRGLRARADLPEDLPASMAGDLDQRAALVAALRSLPMAQREVLVLRYLEDLSEAQIAEQLQLPAGTVKSRAARGLLALRESRMLEGIDA